MLTMLLVACLTTPEPPVFEPRAPGVPGASAAPGVPNSPPPPEQPVVATLMLTLDSPSLDGRRVKVDAMKSPDQGGEVLGTATFDNTTSVSLPLSELPDDFNLWISLDTDGDGAPEFHYEHPDNPLHSATDPVDIVVTKVDWAQVFPGDWHHSPRYVPGGRPITGQVSFEGAGTLQMDVWADPLGVHTLAAVNRYQTGGPFRIDLPADTEQVQFVFKLDQDGDGRSDVRWDPPTKTWDVPAKGLSGLSFRIGEADWGSVDPGARE